MSIDPLLAPWVGRIFRGVVQLAAAAGHRRATELLRFRNRPDWPEGPFDGWIHCASHGEWETVRPVVLHYLAAHPERRLLVTFFSPSGRHASLPNTPRLQSAPLPWDTPAEVHTFLQRTQPRWLLLVQYDVWPALVAGCRSEGIPWGVLNARWSPSLRWSSALWRSASLLTVQNPSDAARFSQTKLPALCVGDTRFDNVLLRVQSASGVGKLTWPAPFVAFNDARGLVVLGSLWPEDAPLVLPLLARFPEYKWVVVPHSISESSIRFWEDKLPVPHILWSTCLSDQPPAHPENARALLVDAVGVLFDLYGLATFAYVGGGRSQGQHNFLEPLAWGVPTAIAQEGSRDRPDAGSAAQAGILHLAQDPVSLAQCWNDWQKTPPKGVQDWVAHQAGAAERTAAAIAAWENTQLG